jgi:hypothetical protein
MGRLARQPSSCTDLELYRWQHQCDVVVIVTDQVIGRLRTRIQLTEKKDAADAKKAMPMLPKARIGNPHRQVPKEGGNVVVGLHDWNGNSSLTNGCF